MNKALMVGLWLLVGSGVAPARECWLDIYDQPNYQGGRQRIEGPAALANLKGLGGQNWNERIESLEVGKDAEVLAFRSENFEIKPQPGPLNHPQAFRSWGRQDLPIYQELEIAFGPGKRAHHLGELDFHRNINSLKVNCRS